jgi:phosphoglycerol geranylgeranyltransferase
MKHNLLAHFLDRKSRKLKSLAVLVDPDKTESLSSLLNLCGQQPPDLFLVGSSLMGENSIADCVRFIRERSTAPVVLFPGNMNQVTKEADALLLLSVISSRNSDLLIGRHVEAAFRVRESGLEIIPTGYILVESGKLTSVHYMSQSMPVPNNKPQIAAATALAGEQLGLKAIYLEAGSGADEVVAPKLISAVAATSKCLLITGGGIVTAELAQQCYSAGSDVVVIGNILETKPELFSQFASIRDQFNS